MLGDIFKYGITGLFLLIDGIVYFLVAQLFELYGFLAKSQILTDTFISDVANRMYVVIGIFMLFVVTYSLLKALVNPDNIKDTGKIATNIIISIVLLSIVPTIFFYARALQNVIVQDNIIGQVVLKDEEVDFTTKGRNISLTMLEAFLDIPDDATGEHNVNWSMLFLSPAGFAASIFKSFGEAPKWEELKSSIDEGAYGNFLKIGLWADTVVSDESANYIPIVSTICGGFMIYCLISFCLDLGVRVIKLGFYQIIAPIPIMMRVIPNKKNVFDNWLKATLATYMEVFIRIFVMVLVVFLASSIFEGGNISSDIVDVGVFGHIIIVLGLFAFAKQAPKLISNVIGIDSGNLKLGIGGKLDASGPLGKGINYVGKGTFGAVTGGLGGAYSAAVNGAGAGAGFLFGALNGWKGKKGQFSRQRQGVYADVLGQKGSAGWFGGRGFFDTQKDRYKDKIKDAYLESETTKVQNVEESAAFKRRVQEETNRQMVENPKKYNELAQQLTEKLNEFEKTKIDKIKELMERMEIERQTFEKDKNRKMRDLQIQLDEARDRKDIARQNQLISQITNMEKSSYSNQYLQNQINLENAKNSTPEIDSIRDEMRKVSTVDEGAIFKSVQKEFMSANTKYKTSSKYVAQREAEKAAKQWREEHADEALIQESIYENAFKNASKGGSVAGFGGKTGGTPPGGESGGGPKDK